VIRRRTARAFARLDVGTFIGYTPVSDLLSCAEPGGPMHSAWLFPALPVVVGAIACSTPAPAPHSPTTVQRERETDAELRDMCPLVVSTSNVEALDIEGGAALAFTTKTDVAELRRRVRRMADLENQNRQWIAARLGNATLPPAHRMLDEVERGARIVFRPADPSRLDELRAGVAAQAGRLISGSCPVPMPRQPGEPPAQIVRR
jgi:hypothetical protein